MNKPIKTEYHCGTTEYNQSVMVTITTEGGAVKVHITKHAASQRDETERIYNLSVQNILSIAEAVSDYEKTKTK